MHSPKPYGLFVHGGELTENDMAAVGHYTKIVSNYKAVSGLNSVKYVRALPDGGEALVYLTGDLFRVICTKPKPTTTEYGEGLALPKIPMFFSGSIDNGVSRMGEGIEVKLTNQCQLRLGDYRYKVNPSHRLQRFRCDYDTLYGVYFIPEALRGLPKERHHITQYDRLKATWYSGAIAEVVQLISGYGRQDFDNLPDNPIERAEFKLPQKVFDKIKEELKDIRLPGYQGVPDIEGVIRYKMTFYETDIVSFDQEKNPWLVRVSTSGVWAMPLPMIPATTTQAFREYIESVDDQEILTLLDRFKGMPSGEGFPMRDDEFYRWVRAGVIIRVCDTADFYQHSAYSSVTGWSANLDGTSLVNTCYTYKDIFCYGYAYSIVLKLGIAEHRGMSPISRVEELDAGEHSRLAEYFKQLFTLLRSAEHYYKYAPTMYKLRRVGKKEILARIPASVNSIRADDNEINFWDNYVTPPIAIHSGATVKVGEGYLFNGGTLKLPEPLLDGCISMNFALLEKPEGGANVPKIDTIAYMYYVGDTLKVIRNFHDDRKVIKETVGNFEDEMIVGNWEQTEYQGLTGLAGEFYSTDIDNRQEIVPTEIHSILEGRDLGYSTPYTTYTAFFYAIGVMSRWRCYSHERVDVTKYAKQIRQCFIVPFFERNATLCGYREQGDCIKTVTSGTRHTARDPNSYYIWTYDTALHWIDSARDVGPFKKKAQPYPSNSVPVWAEVHRHSGYNGSAATDFADSGDWVGGLPADVTRWVNGPNGVTSLTYGGVLPSYPKYLTEEITPYRHDQNLYLAMFDRPALIHTEPHDDWYYSNSPDIYGNVLMVDSCKVVLGSAEYGNISVATQIKPRFSVGHSTIANGRVAHTFIGVINE